MSVADVYALMPRFRELFKGLPTAFGTGDRPGRWIKRPPRPEDWIDHLTGRSNGIGIAPLRPDNHVLFAAIDLDEPDFETGFEMLNFIPGPAFVERTRSGNVHVWVFFRDPCPAWVAMGVLKEVCTAVGKPHTEVFPKNHDFAKVKLGNYINLPYHGDKRPVLCATTAPSTAGCTKHARGPGGSMVCRCQRPLRLNEFLELAEASLNSSRAWEQRAGLLLIQDPAQRKGEAAEFGQQPRLHMCAEYIIEHADTNPLVYGHQSNTMFLLAKQLSNCVLFDHDETLALMREVNSHAQPGLPDSEILRILRNVEEKQYTSLGCDDPVVAPYVHPDCPIAHPRS